MGQAADHRRAHLGIGVDPDDDPANGADDALDGALRRDPQGVRPHPSQYLTPDVSTIVMGAVSLIWTLFIINVSQNVLGDSISGLGFQIAFYYGLTGFACAIYYRKELFKSFRNFFMAGLVPFVGGLMLTGIFIKAAIDYNKVENTYAGKFLGFGVPVAIGMGMLLVGVVVMFIANVVYPSSSSASRRPPTPGFSRAMSKAKRP